MCVGVWEWWWWWWPGWLAGWLAGDGRPEDRDEDEDGATGDAEPVFVCLWRVWGWTGNENGKCVCVMFDLNRRRGRSYSICPLCFWGKHER